MSKLSPELRKRIQDNLPAVVRHFRGAVRAKVTQWGHDADLEDLLNVELELRDVVESFAVACDSPEDADNISERDIVKALSQAVLVELDQPSAD